MQNQTTTIQQKDNESKDLPFDPRTLIDETGRLLKLLYNNRETSHLLGGVDEKTVSRWIKRGLLKKSKASRHVLITAESIRAFLKTTV